MVSLSLPPSSLSLSMSAHFSGGGVGDGDIVASDFTRKSFAEFDDSDGVELPLEGAPDLRFCSGGSTVG